MSSRLVLIPAVLTAIWLASAEAWRAIEPDAALFGDPPPRSLVDAIAGRAGVERVYTLIRHRDPNALLMVRDPELAGPEPIEVSPLVLAVAAGDPDVVQMLLDYGAVPTAPANQVAWCLARDNGDEPVKQMIEIALKGVPPVCPSPSSGGGGALRRFAIPRT